MYRVLPGCGRVRTLATARVAVLAAFALLLAACGAAPNASSSGSAIKAGGTITFALDEELPGFNILQANNSSFQLGEVQNQVWPSVFIVDPDLKAHLDTHLVTSAKVTSTNPQTIVYQINPKAVWSDGVPINAEDFIYNWEAQSGDPRFTDVGGQPFEPGGTTGYSSIKTVTGSNNGKTVTVVFAQPFGDWPSLFSPMVPAHIAKKVGFNDGFQTFGPAVQVSGGPYMMQSYSKGQALVEVPNPRYWGPKPKLSQLVFRIIANDAQQPPAVQNNEVQIVNPMVPNVEFLDSVKSIPGFTVKVAPNLEFQHIDFNEGNPYLANVNVRHAIAYGTDREAIVKRTADEVDPKIKPLNNHIFMATQPQYKDNSAGYGKYDPAKAKQLLAQANMTMGSDGYFHPNFGPETGQDLTFTIITTAGVVTRQEIEQLFQSEMQQTGVKINIQNYPASALGNIQTHGEFDIMLIAWVLSPFPSGVQSIYCSYNNGDLCGSNWDHYANPQEDKLLQQGVNAVNPTQEANDFNQADALLWKDMVTLPLFQNPELFGWSTKDAGIEPNSSGQGLTWNDQDWAVKAG